MSEDNSHLLPLFFGAESSANSQVIVDDQKRRREEVVISPVFSRIDLDQVLLFYSSQQIPYQQKQVIKKDVYVTVCVCVFLKDKYFNPLLRIN